MIVQIACCLFNNNSPLVGVVSGSMEPGFFRGDILLLKDKKLECGDIAVFNARKTPIDIVHRIIKLDHKGRALTKGDNNRGNDIPLYRPGQTRLDPSDLKTTAFFYIPLLALPSIWITTFPILKYLVIIFSLLSIYFTVDDY
ncbi:SEC11 [Hepatospora eriocheir]|uniref:Signal peptidase complex catalytic subunit SEC11 n=1 Tax=Hepatospora eriocheir TaxID=1081669 RepID=A0A1X0QCF7_9MICR|nr:SEC11 [Hepatospora eriocheir]